MEWVEIAKYIDSGVLLAIVVLFIKGCIVSKRSLTDARAEMQKDRENFKEALDIAFKNHQKEVKLITVSYRKKAEANGKVMKELLTLLKKRNTE